MNRSILARLHRLEARTGLGHSVRAMTDEELFSMFLNLIERAGGAEAFAETLKEDGEEQLAETVLQHAACSTVAEFMALEP